MIRILALDLSLNHCGVARLFECRAGQPLIETDDITLPPTRVPGKRPGTLKDGPPLTGVPRLLWWRECLRGEVEGGLVQRVIMELPALRGTGVVLDFGRQLGVVEALLADMGVPLTLVEPTVLKKYATGLGNADKLRMLETAVARFGEQVRGHDQADAAWLALIGWEIFGGGEPEGAYRQAVCARLRAQSCAGETTE